MNAKGALLAGAGIDDTNEKRAIGRLGEGRSGGKGLFLVVEKEVAARDMRGQMVDKLGPEAAALRASMPEGTCRVEGIEHGFEDRQHDRS